MKSFQNTAIAACATILAGCAGQTINMTPEAAKSMQNLAVTKQNDSTNMGLTVVSQQANAAGFGLLFVVIGQAGVDRNNAKAALLTKAFDMQANNPARDFNAQIEKSLTASGYRISWVDAGVDKNGQNVADFSKATGQDTNVQITFSNGYVATNELTSFYPSIVSGVTVTDAKTKAVLHSQLYSYGHATLGKHIDAHPACKFSDLEAMTGNIELTRKCMKDGVDQIAALIANDFKRQ